MVDLRGWERMRRLSSLIIGVFTFLCAFVAVPSKAHACTRSDRVLGGIVRTGSCPDGLSWRYDSNRRAFVKGGQADGGSDRHRYEYVSFSRCDDGTDCMAAHTCEAGGMRYNVQAWLVGPDGSRVEVSPRSDTVCVYPERVVPVADVGALAHEEIRKRITQPTMTASPPGKTLVRNCQDLWIGVS